MVSVSPRLRDSLDYEEPDATDPRLSLGFQSMSIGSHDDEDYEHPEADYRPKSRGSDPTSRKKKRVHYASDEFDSDNEKSIGVVKRKEDIPIPNPQLHYSAA